MGKIVSTRRATFGSICSPATWQNPLRIHSYLAATTYWSALGYRSIARAETGQFYEAPMNCVRSLQSNGREREHIFNASIRPIEQRPDLCGDC